jgi:hypothetical protein
MRRSLPSWPWCRQRPATQLDQVASSASVIQAKTFSCRSPALPSRMSSTTPAAQSQTQKSAISPGSRRPISPARPSDCAAPRRGGMQGHPGVEPLAGQGLHLVAVGQRAQASFRLVPPPTSLATLTATPASRRAFQSHRPLPRNRLLDGQNAICAPRSASSARSSASSQMPCASTDRGCSRPRARTRRGSCARQGTARPPSAPRRGSRPHGSACTGWHRRRTVRRPSPAARACWWARSAR